MNKIVLSNNSYVIAKVTITFAEVPVTLVAERCGVRWTIWAAGDPKINGQGGDLFVAVQDWFAKHGSDRDGDKTQLLSIWAEMPKAVVFRGGGAIGRWWQGAKDGVRCVGWVEYMAMWQEFDSAVRSCASGARLVRIQKRIIRLLKS